MANAFFTTGKQDRHKILSHHQLFLFSISKLKIRANKHFLPNYIFLSELTNFKNNLHPASHLSFNTHDNSYSE